MLQECLLGGEGEEGRQQTRLLCRSSPRQQQERCDNAGTNRNHQGEDAATGVQYVPATQTTPRRRNDTRRTPIWTYHVMRSKRVTCLHGNFTSLRSHSSSHHSDETKREEETFSSLTPCLRPPATINLSMCIYCQNQ